MTCVAVLLLRIKMFLGSWALVFSFLYPDDSFPCNSYLDWESLSPSHWSSSVSLTSVPVSRGCHDKKILEYGDLNRSDGNRNFCYFDFDFSLTFHVSLVTFYMPILYCIPWSITSTYHTSVCSLRCIRNFSQHYE